MQQPQRLFKHEAKLCRHFLQECCNADEGLLIHRTGAALLHQTRLPPISAGLAFNHDYYNNLIDTSRYFIIDVIYSLLEQCLSTAYLWEMCDCVLAKHLDQKQ